MLFLNKNQLLSILDEILSFFLFHRFEKFWLIVITITEFFVVVDVWL